MLVKPVPGRKIRDPRTMAFVPEEGLEVPSTDPFWRQRIEQGDLTEVKERPAAPPISSSQPRPAVQETKDGDAQTSAPSQEKPQ